MKDIKILQPRTSSRTPPLILSSLKIALVHARSSSSELVCAQSTLEVHMFTFCAHNLVLPLLNTRVAEVRKKSGLLILT